MQPIVFIKSCHKYPERRQAQLETWLPELDWAPYLFVLGVPTNAMYGNWLLCNVSDAFADIAPKIQCAAKYALENNFDSAVILDDDTYLRPDRLFWALKSYELHQFDYVGFLRVSGIGYNQDKPYCQGSCYYVSGRAMEWIAESVEMRPGVIDDGAVGRALYHKVFPVHDDRFQPGPEPVYPHPTNEIISAHKCHTAALMHRAHDVWKTVV